MRSEVLIFPDLSSIPVLRNQIYLSSKSATEPLRRRQHTRAAGQQSPWSSCTDPIGIRICRSGRGKVRGANPGTRGLGINLKPTPVLQVNTSTTELTDNEISKRKPRPSPCLSSKQKPPTEPSSCVRLTFPSVQGAENSPLLSGNINTFAATPTETAASFYRLVLVHGHKAWSRVPGFLCSCSLCSSCPTESWSCSLARVFLLDTAFEATFWLVVKHASCYSALNGRSKLAQPSQFRKCVQHCGRCEGHLNCREVV